ncbi:hypothetical protein JVU11DRAFT_1930 [Chiua virens]|nr:hypothetical protein JVU11DRAFT_1930 [Chiua virens]
MPTIGYGVFQLAPELCTEAVVSALKSGYRHIDSAQFYRNEAEVGEGVRKSDTPRNQIFITSKVANTGHSYDQTLKSIEESVRMLGFNYYDLFLIHSPHGGRNGRLARYKALVEAKARGLVRAIGVSNYSKKHIEEIAEAGLEQPAVNQVELHPWCQQRPIVSYCKSKGIVVQAYTPLVRGNDVHGKSAAQVLIRWSLQKGLVPLPKATSAHRIEENFQVFDFALDADDVTAIDAFDEGARVTARDAMGRSQRRGAPTSVNEHTTNSLPRSPSPTMIPMSLSSGSALQNRLLSFLLFLVFVHSSFSQPATLAFGDCYNGDASRKMSVDTVYSQLIDEQTINFTVLGETATEIISSNANTTLAATLFTDTTTLTIATYNNSSFLCNLIRPPSPSTSTGCPIPAGPYAFAVSIPFDSKNLLTTMNTQLRALDTNEQEILCLTVATTPLEPGPVNSPYGSAHIIFWATVGLAIAYWLLVGIARITAAGGRGLSRPGPGIWHGVQRAGFILASAISGERLATSPALMRFCSPSLRDIMMHTQWCAALSMVAVQWPPFIYPLLSQTSWATLTYNITLIPNSEHWNLLDVQPYNPLSTFADQLSDPNSILYINSSIPNSLFLLPPGTPNGMAAFAWSVGVSPQNLFGICLSIFLAILAGIIVISLSIWMVDVIFSRKSSSTGLPTSAIKGRSPRQSAGSKDMLDATAEESRSLNGLSHAYPTLRRRWFRPDFRSFHTSVLIGNLVRVLSIFHFPVTVFSAYEFTTATSTSSIALGALSFAVFSVALPVLLLLRLSRTPTSKLYDETRTLLSLGPLYNHFRPGSQLFSGLFLLSNLVNGVVIGGGQKSGTVQAIVILVSEVASALITSIWLPWGTGAGMSLISFLFCVARIVIAVLLVVLTPTISIGSAASGWVAYGILIVLCLVYLAFSLILLVKITEALVRILGRWSHWYTRPPWVLWDSQEWTRTQTLHKRSDVRESYTVRDSGSFIPPNTPFTQPVEGSGASHHSGPPPSVLRPEQALRPYKEDSDDDESTHIMAAWQPFPGPGGRPSYDRAESSPRTQTSNSGFSRVGGGRAHFDSPYAIAGGKEGSTLTFPSVERRGSGPGESPQAVHREVGDAPTPTTSVANVARMPVLTNSGLPAGRTMSQTAIVVGAIAAGSSTAPESHPLVETGEQGSRGDNVANVDASSQPRKKHWFNIRRNRRHSDGLVLDDVEEDETAAAVSSSKGPGRSFVVIRDRRPTSARPSEARAGQKPRQSLDDSRRDTNS